MIKFKFLRIYYNKLIKRMQNLIGYIIKMGNQFLLRLEIFLNFLRFDYFGIMVYQTTAS